jgi:hypothetical protein
VVIFGAKLDVINLVHVVKRQGFDQSNFVFFATNQTQHAEVSRYINFIKIYHCLVAAVSTMSKMYFMLCEHVCTEHLFCKLGR